MTAKKKFRELLVLASVPVETLPVRTMLNFDEIRPVGGRLSYEAIFRNSHIRLVETGPGMVNSAQGITAAIEQKIPDAILMIGIGGGFTAAGMKIGDIGIASEENFAELGIEPDRTGDPLFSLPFPVTKRGGREYMGKFPTDEALALRAHELLKENFREEGVTILLSPFVTVSTITATDLRAKRLFSTFKPCVENMEGAAAAQVSLHYGIPFIEIRCASNLVGKRDRQSWDIPLACKRSAEAAMVCLKELF